MFFFNFRLSGSEEVRLFLLVLHSCHPVVSRGGEGPHGMSSYYIRYNVITHHDSHHM